MAEDLGLRLIGEINKKKTIDQINRDLNDIEKSIKKLDLNIDLSSLTKNVKSQLNQLSKGLSGSNDVVTNAFKVDIDEVRKTNKEASKLMLDLQKKYNANLSTITENSIFKDGKKQITSYLATYEDAMGRIYKSRVEQFDHLDNQWAEKNLQIIDSTAKEHRDYVNWWEKQSVNIREQERKNLEAEKKKTAELKEQIELYQRQAQINAQNVRQKYGSILTDDDNKRLNTYLKNVKDLDATTPNVSKKMKDLSLDFKDLNSRINSSSSHVMGFGEQLKIAVTRIPIWIK